MEIYKNSVELVARAISVGGYSIIPTQIMGNDVECTIELWIVDEKTRNGTQVTRKGKHKDGKFKTSCNNIPIIIDINTGILRKDRTKKK